MFSGARERVYWEHMGQGNSNLDGNIFLHSVICSHRGHCKNACEIYVWVSTNFTSYVFFIFIATTSYVLFSFYSYPTSVFETDSSDSGKFFLF